MWSLPSFKGLAVFSLAMPTAWAAAISIESSSSSFDTPVHLDGFPHPNPTKSYWQDPPHRIANLRSTPDLPTDQTFDYVIIGSGISGAATAFKLLSRNPSLYVLMIEARAAASGASGRNGGHCKTGDYKKIKQWVDLYGEDEALKIGRLEQDCVNDMRNFVSSHNVSSGWQDVETADLYYTKEEFEKAAEVVEFQQELAKRRPDDIPQGNPRTVFRGQEARDYWHWPEILGAITYAGHTQNPYLTVCAILELGLEKGLNLQTHTMALKLAQVSDRTWKVETDRGTVKGSKVVLATNGFTPALHPGFASTRFLEPVRNQASAVRPVADTSQNPVFRRSNGYSDFPGGGGNGDYIITTRQKSGDNAGPGDVIYGGGQGLSPTGERNLTDDSVIDERIAEYLRGVGRVTYGHRNWGETTAEHVADWTGIVCRTPDGLPVVGPVPGDEGLWASVCMNGHGMAWAFRSAEALVEMMVEGEAPAWFPEPFRAERAWKIGH
ncbi:oxidoreductase ordL [Apiospora arundinis]|uniref:Oxidoreductase ordL n=1 Tax=Apiospora arundinis TaxID=335852 RepID=A0ABR2HYE8_9PEZI